MKIALWKNRRRRIWPVIEEKLRIATRCSFELIRHEACGPILKTFYQRENAIRRGSADGEFVQANEREVVWTRAGKWAKRLQDEAGYLILSRSDDLGPIRCSLTLIAPSLFDIAERIDKSQAGLVNTSGSVGCLLDIHERDPDGLFSLVTWNEDGSS